MYLKSIEIHGFKSFANKTILKFHKGITGIVGPNGSGKSNVADAVRWVLGEQSAKQLRGAKMEDVIFSGTESRKPLGFAYVAITLDNSDRKLNIDYDQVTVARRVYRSGESEYLMNGSACRLKDVQELFFDTGIGKEGYSIIGQGQVDKILNGKPEERRELFDEAVGIVKYKKRKALTEKNLEAEQQNLYRINDILSELEKQVGPLERQSQKAKEYLKLRDGLKSYDVNMYLVEYGRLREQAKELEEKIAIVTGDYEETQKSFEKTKEEYDRLELLNEKYEAKLEVTREALSERRLCKEKLEGEIKVYEGQMASAHETAGHFNSRLESIQNSIKDKKADKKQQIDDKKIVDADIQRLSKDKDDAEGELKLVSGSILALRESIDANNGDMILYMNQAAAIKTKMQRLDTMVEQINIRRSELNQRLIRIQSDEDSGKALLEEYKKELKEIHDNISGLRGEGASLERFGGEIQNRINNLHQNVASKEQEYHGMTSKYNTLKNITERYEGYGNSIKRVMEQKERFPGIIGVVADIIKVKKEYEVAIEIALGGSIQNVVTDNEGTAKRLISFLKENRFGRATFLPLTSISSRELPSAKDILKEPGVIGVASQLVDHDPKYQGLVSYLLGRIVVTDHIDHALELAKKYRYSLRIVTVEGESLSPGGSMSGGAYKNNSNLLGRHREIEEIGTKITSLKKEIGQLRQETDDAHESKQQNKKRLEGLRIQLQELHLKENTAKMNITQTEDKQADNTLLYKTLDEEMQGQKSEIAKIEQERMGLMDQLSVLEDQQKTAETAIAALSERLDDQIEKEKSVNDQTSDLMINATKLAQQQAFIEENIQRIDREVAVFEEELQKADQDYKNSQMIIEESRKNIGLLQKEQEKAEEEIKKLLESYEAEQSQKDEVSKGHKAFFTQRESLSGRLSELDKELFRLNNQQEKVEERRTAGSNYMWEEYELTFNAALGFKNDEIFDKGYDFMKKMVKSLKNDIKELGNVNVNAIEEYQDVSKRYELLKSQHSDLVEGAEKLRDIIKTLDQSMREQFNTNFAIIQTQFNVVFKELFGGGKGTLELMEDMDVLDAGIRIVAQPPGKKLQNMMQLSGGEKALTAIALLFAIQSLKPSPFCLLDEIEAALDDANVKRYAQYLNNLTKDTQFIIITHRRGTMNAADVLYGVTMQEKGISTLVSVSLIENELTK